MSRATPPPRTTGDELPILDGRGCLTLEALCFTELLGPDHRAVVERHVRGCTICAQQQASLARAAQRLRRDKPHVAVPADARVVGRQAMLRSLLLQRREPAAEAPAAIPRPPGGTAWWIWILVGLGAAAAIAGALLALAMR